jgi:GTPase
VSTLDEAIKRLPTDMQEMFRFIWNSLPPSERKALAQLITSFPNQTNLIRLLLSLSTVQFKLAFGQKKRVAIIGPANAGKSTLYNHFVQKNEDKAVVSPIPGTTRINQHADTGLFALVDTPGTDAAGSLGEIERLHALNAAKEADFIIIIFDAAQGIKKNEMDLFNYLSSLGKPYIVVLNKMDLVRRQSSQVIETIAKTLDVQIDQVIPIIAKDGKGISEVLLAIAVTEPEIVAALGQALPEYRWQLAWRTITSSASVSAAIALTPLPIIDFGPLVINQSLMVLGIARVYDYKITLERARELVATFGLGMLGRTLFQQLSKFAGVPGWLLSSAIATATTVVMGYSAAIWFERGERLSQDSMKAITQSVTVYLLDALKNVGKRKPGRKSIQDHINKALDESPMAQERALLDEKANPLPPQTDLTG